MYYLYKICIRCQMCPKNTSGTNNESDLRLVFFYLFLFEYTSWHKHWPTYCPLNYNVGFRYCVKWLQVCINHFCCEYKPQLVIIGRRVKLKFQFHCWRTKKYCLCGPTTQLVTEFSYFHFNNWQWFGWELLVKWFWSLKGLIFLA